MQNTPVSEGGEPVPTLVMVLTGGLALLAGLIVKAAPVSNGPVTDPARFFTTR